MLCNILAVGDVCSPSGTEFLCRNLGRLKRENQVDFAVVNGENAAGMGLLPEQAEDMLRAGADVITLGNHTWSRQQIVPYLDEEPCILRPANLAPGLPGRGWGVFDGPKGLRVGVMNLIGRCQLCDTASDPFRAADRILEEMQADVILVDFHGELTSEKLALGYYLDGRVSALWGTHTHVPTADAHCLPKGTGYVTDLGMTGPAVSVLGMKPELSINRFLGGIPHRFEAAPGPCKLEGVLFTVDTAAGMCTGAKRVDLHP